MFSFFVTLFVDLFSLGQIEVICNKVFSLITILDTEGKNE